MQSIIFVPTVSKLVVPCAQWLISDALLQELILA